MYAAIAKNGEPINGIKAVALVLLISGHFVVVKLDICYLLSFLSSIAEDMYF